MNIRIIATALFFAMSSFAAAQEPNQEEMARFSEKLQLKEAANQARDFALAFKAFAGQFGEDIVEKTSPFNAAAAAKYSAEYSIRALISPEVAEESASSPGTWPTMPSLRRPTLLNLRLKSLPWLRTAKRPRLRRNWLDTTSHSPRHSMARCERAKLFNQASAS